MRHADLLDWLEIRLGLVWLETAPAPVTARAPSGDMVYPDRAQREALRELVTLGYYRGILNQLDDIERLWPQCAEFVSTMRDQAKQFQFETMLVQLDSVANEA